MFYVALLIAHHEPPRSDAVYEEISDYNRLNFTPTPCNSGHLQLQSLLLKIDIKETGGSGVIPTCRNVCYEETQCNEGVSELKKNINSTDNHSRETIPDQNVKLRDRVNTPCTSDQTKRKPSYQNTAMLSALSCTLVDQNEAYNAIEQDFETT